MDRPPLDETLMPSITQKRRQVRIAASDEVNIRKDLQPNYFDRVDVHDGWERDLAQEKKRMRKLEAKRKRWAKLKQRLEQSRAQGASEEELADIEEELKEQGYDEDEDAADSDEDETKMAALAVRERKLCAFWNTYVSHNPKSYLSKLRTALALTFDLGHRDPNCSEILPWMWVGDATAAADIGNLKRKGITHVLNVTNDLKNHFPDNFIYKQLKIEDSVHEDLSLVLDRGVRFVCRVADCRGRILVHCKAGVCRSVSLAIAYLVVDKQLSLADAYDFVNERRPITNVNDHFLFQLAELEVRQGHGCSVLDRKDVFRTIMELNLLRMTPGMKLRPAVGLWRTVMVLLSGTKTRRPAKDDKTRPKDKGPAKAGADAGGDADAAKAAEAAVEKPSKKKKRGQYQLREKKG